MRADLRPRRGLSVLEAVAALAIVGATSAGALAVAGGGVRAAERARLAHGLEALVAERLVQTALATDGELQRLPDSLAAGTFAPPFAHVRWQARVAPRATVAGLHDITLTLTWPTGTHVTHTAIYRTPAIVPTPRGTR